MAHSHEDPTPHSGRVRIDNEDACEITWDLVYGQAKSAYRLGELT